MQQAAKPLSRNAVHQANDDFYRRHPEMGRGGGGLSLELKLVHSEIVEGAIAGETCLTAELAGTQGEEVKVEFAIEFEGVKGKVTLKAAWGIVELKREFQIIQKREILRHEWDFAEKE